MKRCIALGLIITVFMLLIISCDKDEAVEKQAETIKIGVLLPLTLEGVQSVINRKLNSIVLAGEEINNNGLLLGEKIELVIMDNEGNDTKNLAAARQLIDQGCIAIIGPVWSSRSIDVAQKVTIPNNIVQICLSTSPAISQLQDKDLVFRTIPSDAFQGKVVAKYARMSLGAQTAGIIFVNNEFGLGLADTFKDEYTALGGKVISFIEYPELEDYSLYDFTENTRQLIKDEPEIIYFVNYVEDAVKIVTTLHSHISYHPRLLGCQLLSYTDFLPPNSPADFVNGMIVFNPGVSKNNKQLNEFKTNYFNRFHETINDPSVTNTYDALYVLAYAILKAQSSDPNVFKNYITTVCSEEGEIISVNEYAKAKNLIESGGEMNYIGATGQLAFDDNGDLKKATYLTLQINESELIEVGSIDYE